MPCNDPGYQGAQGAQGPQGMDGSLVGGYTILNVDIIPRVDPLVAGAIWLDGDIVKISQGAI